MPFRIMSKDLQMKPASHFSSPQTGILGAEEYTDSLADQLKSYTKFWPLFIVCVAICISVAYLYLRSETPVYTVHAKILINDENVGPSVNMETQDVVANKKVEDEIEIITSRTIMEQVVNDLGLAHSYVLISDFQPADIYASTPIKLNVHSTSTDFSGEPIEITILDNNAFLLKQANSKSKFFFGERLRSKWGSWQLNKTAFAMAYIGKTVRIYPGVARDFTDNYLGGFQAAPQAEKSAVLQLSIRETVPERGADVINGVIKAYNMASVDYRNKVNQSTLNFLNDRLNALTRELNNIEKRIENYKSSRGITNLNAESQVYLENVKNNDSRLNEVNVQLEIINEIQNYINSPISSGNAPAIAGISDPGLISLIEQLIKLETQRERLLSNTPEKNPLFVPLNRQISTTKNAIRENIKGIKRSILATRNQLRHFNQKFETSIKKLPGQEREYINIKRQQSIKEELYIFLLQKREETGMNNASKLMESRIIDHAHFGPPETHNPSFTYTLALIFGIVAPAGLIFAKNTLNNKVLSLKEIKTAVYAPMIAELSYQKSLPTMLDAKGTRTIMAEQFRSLRTKLIQVNGRSGNGKITMLTSGIPGEGKSMVCRNLGAVMAAAGRKTVMVDADLRKPQLATALALPGNIGLSDYLNGNATIEEILQSSNFHGNLFVISAGSHINNPSEQLEKAEVEQLFTWLRIYFDEVIIDTPPVELVTDALILTKFSDSTLFVLRQNYTYKSQLRSLSQMCVDGTFNNLQLIFNGVSSGESSRYYRKYGSHYYEEKGHKLRLSLFKSH